MRKLDQFVTCKAKKLLNEKKNHHLCQMIAQHITEFVFIAKIVSPSRIHYIFINDAGLKITKLHVGANYFEKDITDVHKAKRAKKIKSKFREVMKTGQVISFFEKIELMDQQYLYGETTLTPLKDSDGQIEYIVETIKDVTKLFNEKQQINRSKQSYRSVIDHNIDGILQIDLTGKIIDSNPAIQKITGYTKKQINHRSFYHLVPDSDIPVYKDLIERTKKGESLESIDCRFIHRNGHYMLLQFKTIPIVIDLNIHGIFLILRDISEQAKNVETIKFMAFHDQLTGLLNRRALLNDLGSFITRAKETNSEVAILSIDIDRFKYINDTLGHLVGDELLKKIADRLVELQPINGCVYRQGGDEFIFVLENTSRQEVAQFANRILKRFTEAFYLETNEYYISPSIGISMFPDNGTDEEMLLKNADEALFQVKEQGRAHYQFYRYEMNATNANFVEIASYLHKAIERDELMLYFQPQINLRTKEINSFEVLLRWYNPALGYVSPGDFIPLAEDTGLIIPIGKWVIQQTCKQIKRWNDKGFHHFRFAINISPRQFQPSLINIIKKEIDYFQIDASNLEIEITEGVMKDMEEAIPILNEIKKLGIVISVDDFGTGYSSLNYLKRFPIDVLKIDRSFIKDVVNNQKDAAVTTTIIHLGRSLGMEVIAEGVEYKHQADFLKENYCHKAQGYYFAKPLPAIEIEKYFTDS